MIRASSVFVLFLLILTISYASSVPGEYFVAMASMALSMQRQLLLYIISNNVCVFAWNFLLSPDMKQLEANPDAKRLYDDLLSNYNRLIRPVVNNTETLTVWLGLKLSQLIEVNLKNQVMTTNLWVPQVRGV